MEIVLTVSLYMMFSIGTFIVYAFLKEVGAISGFIELTYTHPHFDKVLVIVGDILFGLGVGLIGSVAFYYYQAGVIVFKALVYGIIMIIMGSTLKEYFKKG